MTDKLREAAQQDTVDVHMCKETDGLSFGKRKECPHCTAAQQDAQAVAQEPIGSVYRNSETGEFELLDYKLSDQPPGTHQDIYTAPTPPAQQDAQAVPHGYKLIDADELRHIVRDVNQHIEQAAASEALEASRHPGYGTGIHTHIQRQMRKITAMLNAAPTPPAQQGEEFWPAPLSEFKEGQWWVAELDAMARSVNATDEQKRAVSVVHHLLASAEKAVATPPAQQEPVGVLTMRDDMGAELKFNRNITLLPGQTLTLYDTPPAQQEWIDDAGRLQWALWRIKDLERQLAGRPAVITPPEQS